MPFLSDKQTLADLNLLGKYKPNSIFSLFNKVLTDGGERLLQEMFGQPLTDAGQINTRSSIFRYFQENDYTLALDRGTFIQMENYLSGSAGTNYLSGSAGTNYLPDNAGDNYLSGGPGGSYLLVLAGTLKKKLSASLFRDEQYRQLQEGLRATIKVLNIVYDLIEKLGEEQLNKGQQDHIHLTSPYDPQRTLLLKILSHPRLSWLRSERDSTGFPALRLARYDHLLRHVLRDGMEIFLKEVYALDVYLAVGGTGRAGGFSYARALPKEQHHFRTSALRHPSLPNGVANPLSLDSQHNMLFLTGANMAGKSTFMKAFGIAVYLAHMGFPVAAADMSFSVLDGLYSSINVPDDLNQGYSHFYAEVLRVRTVAQEVSEGKNLVVLFDELFKGTNVKDAYDATLSVTEAFSGYRNCAFMISTHIIEVGQALSTRCSTIQFAYLPTVMEGHTPQYTYRLKEGITSDRQGMIIIENEGILGML
jgi:hypothetical protein